MSAFHEALKVEREGWEHVRPWVQGVTGNTYAALFADPDVQRDGYDGTGTFPRYGAGTRWELKCEQKDRHGNFFFETWSNKCFGRARDGWMYRCSAGLLLYYFLDPGDLYVIEGGRLWAWFFGEPPHAPAQFRYPEKPQRRFEQPNETWGHPVPFEDVHTALGMYHARRQTDGSFKVVRDSRKPQGGGK